MLVDDHDSFRQTLAFMLEREADFSVISQADSVAAARPALEELLEGGNEPDVLVVDLDLTDGTGTEVIQTLRGRKSRTLPLVLSGFSEQDRLAWAVDAGAAGVMHKSSSLPEIMEAIRRLRAGEQLVSQTEVLEAVRLVGRERVEKREAERLSDLLTTREVEILQALAEGLGDRDISGRLGIGVGTVRTHMSSVLTKLEADSRLQALVMAVRHGLVQIR